MVSTKIFCFSHYKSMGANDPQGVATVGPRGMIGRIYVGDSTPKNRKNSRSGPKLRILDWFQTPQNANKSVQPKVCALNPIFSPTNQFSRINDV